MSNPSISSLGSPGSPGLDLTPAGQSPGTGSPSSDLNSRVSGSVSPRLASYPQLSRPGSAETNWEERIEAWERDSSGGSISLGERLSQEIAKPASPNRLFTVLTRSSTPEVERICRLGDALLLISPQPIGTGGQAAVRPVARLALKEHKISIEAAEGQSVLRSESADLDRGVGPSTLAASFRDTVAPMRFSIETHARAAEACPEGVVKLLEWGAETQESPHTLRIVMHQELERAAGDLTQLLPRSRTVAGSAASRSAGADLSAKLAPEIALQHAQELTTGLAKLHAADIVHLDIKPQNVLIFPAQEGLLRAKWADFGCANQLAVFRRGMLSQGELEPISEVEAMLTQEALKRAIPFPHTMLYAPPEAFPAAAVSGASDLENPIMGKLYDVFSMGIVLWQLGSGSWPDSLSHRLTLSNVRMLLVGGPIDLKQHKAMVDRVLADPELSINPLILTACFCLHPSRDLRPKDGGTIAELLELAKLSPEDMQQRLRSLDSQHTNIS